MSANGVSGSHGSDHIGPPDPAPPRVDLSGVGFGDVLRAINPLQYLPVVGTIYRVATGDAAPLGLRAAVSAVLGIVTGGPVGLLGSIAGSLAEQFFHVEGRIREALASPAASVGVSGEGPARGEPTHARAEADLGQLPSTLTGSPSALPPARVANAYRAAGLLGAV